MLGELLFWDIPTGLLVASLREPHALPKAAKPAWHRRDESGLMLEDPIETARDLGLVPLSTGRCPPTRSSASDALGVCG